MVPAHLRNWRLLGEAQPPPSSPLLPAPPRSSPLLGADGADEAASKPDAGRQRALLCSCWQAKPRRLELLLAGRDEQQPRGGANGGMKVRAALLFLRERKCTSE